MAWPGKGLRRASVNSFGYGGSNAHVIVDDAHHYLLERRLVGKHATVASPPTCWPADGVDTQAPLQDSNRPQLLVWSTSDEGGLQRTAAAYGSHLGRLQGGNDGYLESLAYTLARRRTHMPWKSFIIAKSVPDLQRRLADDLLSKPRRSSASLRPTLAFVFTGQGAQWHAMGRQLSAYPAFRNSLVDAETCLAGLGCEWKVTGKQELHFDQQRD